MFQKLKERMFGRVVHEEDIDLERTLEILQELANRNPENKGSLTIYEAFDRYHTIGAPFAHMVEYVRDNTKYLQDQYIFQGQYKVTEKDRQRHTLRLDKRRVDAVVGDRKLLGYTRQFISVAWIADRGYQIPQHSSGGAA